MNIFIIQVTNWYSWYYLKSFLKSLVKHNCWISILVLWQLNLISEDNFYRRICRTLHFLNFCSFSEHCLSTAGIWSLGYTHQVILRQHIRFPSFYSFYIALKQIRMSSFLKINLSFISKLLMTFRLHFSDYSSRKIPDNTSNRPVTIYVAR